MIDDLTVSKGSLHFSLLEAKYQNLAKEGGFSLGAAYTNLVLESQQSSTNAFGDIYRILSAGNKPVTQGLFGEIRAQLLTFQNSNVDEILKSLKQSANVTELDRNYFADEDVSRAYEVRYDLYTQAYQFRQSKIAVPEMIGQQWRPLQDLAKTMGAIRSKVDAYKGRYKTELNATCQYLLEEAQVSSNQRTIQEYIAFVTSQLNALVAAKASGLSLESLQTAKTFLEKVDSDLTSQALTQVPPPEQPALLPLRTRSEGVKGILIGRFAQAKDAALGGQLGFPVAFDNQDKILSLDDLVKLRADIGNLEKELALPVVVFFPNGPLQLLKKKAGLYAPILAGLAGDNKVARPCVIGVDPKISDKASRFRWVGMTIGSKPAVMKEISGGAQDFGSIPLDQGLKIEVRKFIDPAKPGDVETKPVNKDDEFWLWGPLELIRKYQGNTRRSADGRTWQVILPVADDQQQGAIGITLVFDPPLPALTDWPKVQTWNQ
jgi:hypothetical protein